MDYPIIADVLSHFDGRLVGRVSIKIKRYQQGRSYGGPGGGGTFPPQILGAPPPPKCPPPPPQKIMHTYLFICQYRACV